MQVFVVICGSQVKTIKTIRVTVSNNLNEKSALIPCISSVPTIVITKRQNKNTKTFTNNEKFHILTSSDISYPHFIISVFWRQRAATMHNRLFLLSKVQRLITYFTKFTDWLKALSIPIPIFMLLFNKFSNISTMCEVQRFSKRKHWIFHGTTPQETDTMYTFIFYYTVHISHCSVLIVC